MKNASGSALPFGFPIRVVAQKTGLTTAAIRAWERRYGAVDPRRSEAGQRVYSEQDVERLGLLAALVGNGHSISAVAALDTEALEALVEEALRPTPDHRGDGAAGLVERAIAMVEGLRPDELERLLMRSAVSLRTEEVIHGLLVPLLQAIGSSWKQGRMGPASEHVATITIRRFLQWLSTTAQVDTQAPVLVTGTPRGQRHEFGALLAGLIGADEGWQIRFLGPDLPGAEIARGTSSFSATVVALSAIHPSLDDEAVDDIVSIRKMLPDRVDVILGGPAAAEHADAWSAAGILFYPTLEEFRIGLKRIKRVRFGAINP